MVNITSRFLALHPDCVSVDPRAVAKALRWFRQQHTKAFQIYLSSKDLFLLFGSTIPSKEVLFIGCFFFAGRNVWLSLFVLVAWTCRPHISHHHRKWPAACFEVPAEVFIIPTISGDTRRQTRRPLLTLLMLCTHPALLPTQSFATKRLLECRTSVY